MDAYFKVVIKGTTLPYEYVNTYLMNNYVKIDNVNKLLVDNNTLVTLNKKTKHYYKLPLDRIDFKYKFHWCIVYQVSRGKNVVRKSDTTYDLVYDIVLLIHNGTKEILSNLLDESKEWYDKNILNKEKTDQQIICYNWEWSWEVANKQDKRKEETLYYDKEFMDEITNDIQKFLSDKVKTLYNRLGITYKRTYLFEGPPGTGKSSLIYGIASMLNLDIAYLNITDELKNNSMVESLRNIPDNSILVIEDIDSIFDKRDKKENHHISFSSLLNSLDGVIKPNSGSIIIFTTNFKNKLDEALKRPGRIDKVVTFNYASKEQIHKMFVNYFPSEEKNFNSFYASIKGIKKITICYLQQYFLKYLIDNDIKDMYENTSELNKMVNDCDLYKKPINLYC